VNTVIKIPSTSCEAKGLLLKLNSLETAFMATLWDDIILLWKGSI